MEAQEPAPRTGSNWAAVASLVAGILALVVFMFLSIPIGLILAIVGLGLGNVGRTWAGTRGLGGVAIAGLVLSFLTIGISFVTNLLAD